MHILVSVAWIGVDACVLLLAALGSAAGNAVLARSAFVVLGPIAVDLLLPLPLLALFTGIVLSLGTRWGLLRYYWVLVSLVLTTAAAAAVLFELRPRLITASARAQAGLAVGAVGHQIMVAAAVALVVLCVITAINVVKPWGRTQRRNSG